MSILTNIRRYRIVGALTTLVLLASVVGGAWAYFSSTGAGAASASVGSVSVPGSPSAHVAASADRVLISWGAATLSNGDAVQGYIVTRSDGASVCGTSSALFSGAPLACEDTNVVSDATYRYTVAAVYHSFSASAQTGFVTVQSAPRVTSTSSNALGQGATKDVVVHGEGFVNGAQVSVSGPGITVESTTVDDSAQATANIAIAAGAATGPRDVTVTNTDGGTATLTGGMTVNAAPTVGSLSPGALPQGALKDVVVHGAGFVSGAQVSFSGTGITVNSTHLETATQLTATIALDAAAGTGARDVTVTNTDGGTSTFTAGFTVNAPPSVSSLNPNALSQGVSGDIVITGSGFASGASASFPGTGITVNSTRFDSATQLTANITVAADAAIGTSDVTIANPDGGAATKTAAFTVNPGPMLSSLNPSALGQGASNQNVVITGSAFANGASASFAGDGITVNWTMFNSATQLTANITLDAIAPPGARDVTVTNTDGGTVTKLSAFTVNAGPTLTSLTPSSRGQGASGQSVVIAGTGFASGAKASFGAGITVNSTHVDSPTQLTATITLDANAPTGARDVAVANTDGGAATRTGAFTVDPGPTVSSSSPSSRGQGASGQSIVIAGTGFASGTNVSFGAGITVNSVHFDSASQMTATITVAAGATPGARDVIVTNTDGGAVTKTAAFTVNAAPTVGSLSPSVLKRNTTNQSIVVTGTGFASGTGLAAAFSGTGITVVSTTYGSPTQVTAVISIASSAAVGLRDVTVTNPDAGIGTKTGAFTVSVAPTLTSVSPSTLPQGATNRDLTITGNNFVTGATVSIAGAGVTVNSTAYNSATQLAANVTITASAYQGGHNVTVTNPGNLSTSQNLFTVTAGPIISTLIPGAAKQGTSNRDVVITGTGFLSGTGLITSFTPTTGIHVNSTTYNGPTQVTANISIDPAADAGARDITVTNPDFGSATKPGGFVVTPVNPPTISSVSAIVRPSALVGPTAQTLTITGSNFVSGASPSFAASGINVFSTTYNSATQLTLGVTVDPSATLGASSITVTNPDGVAGSCSTCVNVYSVDLVSRVSGNPFGPPYALTTITPVTISAGATYLVFAYDKSSIGDGATLATSGFTTSPGLTPIGAQQDYNSGVDHNWAWVMSGGSGTGQITATFAKQPANNWSYLYVVAIGGAGANPVVAQASAIGITNPATATLPGTPGASDAEIVFWSADGNAGNALSVTSPFAAVYNSAGSSSSGSLGVFAGPASPSAVNITMNTSHPWGTTALEIAHP